jgi:hypothetical protein
VVAVDVTVDVAVLLGPGVTVGGPATGVRVTKAVGEANGVIVTVRVLVGIGVPLGVGDSAGVRVGLGVRVRVGTLVGGLRVGTRVGTRRVWRAGSGVSCSIMIGTVGGSGPPGPIAVAVGRRSTTSSSGTRSHDAAVMTIKARARHAISRPI